MENNHENANTEPVDQKTLVEAEGNKGKQISKPIANANKEKVSQSPTALHKLNKSVTNLDRTKEAQEKLLQIAINNTNPNKVFDVLAKPNDTTTKPPESVSKNEIPGHKDSPDSPTTQLNIQQHEAGADSQNMETPKQITQIKTDKHGVDVQNTETCVLPDYAELVVPIPKCFTYKHHSHIDDSLSDTPGPSRITRAEYLNHVENDTVSQIYSSSFSTLCCSATMSEDTKDTQNNSELPSYIESGIQNEEELTETNLQSMESSQPSLTISQAIQYNQQFLEELEKLRKKDEATKEHRSIAPMLIVPKVCQQTQKETETMSAKDSEVLKEIAIQSVDLNVATCSNMSRPISLVSKEAKDHQAALAGASNQCPVTFLNPQKLAPITVQPLPNSYSLSTSLKSVMILAQARPNEPQPLMLQALAKLNTSSLSLALSSGFKTRSSLPGCIPVYKNSELSPPDSLTSAPPSYSFVLRQSAARRRPRLMGTFIPSPSFVQRPPPPTYAAVFDIYVDGPVPPQPTRVYSFGFNEMPIICPECGYAGMTSVTARITLCTHLCAFLLCLFCCWICAPLPYIMRSCKDVYHYCRNCRNYLGMYSPHNAEAPFSV